MLFIPPAVRRPSERRLGTDFGQTPYHLRHVQRPTRVAMESGFSRRGGETEMAGLMKRVSEGPDVDMDVECRCIT